MYNQKYYLLKFLFNLQNSIDNLQKYKWPTFIWHTTINNYRAVIPYEKKKILC